MHAHDAKDASKARRQPGQLLFCGFEGTSVPDDLAALVAAGRIGGVILFARNVESPAQVRALTARLHALAPAGAPLLIAIDQEGGRVQRLRSPWTEWPPMRALGDADDPALTEGVARALARELRDLGIGLDFAPCVDVDTNPANPVIGDRSFGRDPAAVARHAARFIEALQSAGVAACAKHFPGHGDTASDSHLELPRLDHGLERLRAVELPPFRAAVAAGVASIMTAHILFPALDADRPATLSPEVMRLLRGELGFEGVVFSDDLEMKAVADHYAPAVLVRESLSAGVDALLVCREATLRDEVLALLERIDPPRLARSLERMAALKARFGGAGAPSLAPPYAAHAELARRLARGVARGIA
jgi:beta-N-acetylhexosaminidase